MDKFNFVNIIKKHYSAFYNANISDENNRIIDKCSIFWYHFYPLIGLGLIVLYWYYKTISDTGYFSFEKFFISAMIDSNFISSTITTVAIFTPLLFSTLILMFDMHNKFQNQLSSLTGVNTDETIIVKNKVIVTNEMFAHICFSIILCIFILLCSLIYFVITYPLLLFIISSIDIYMILLFFETLFMIMKRLFNLIYQY